jgi:hypothetical protein
MRFTVNLQRLPGLARWASAFQTLFSFAGVSSPHGELDAKRAAFGGNAGDWERSAETGPNPKDEL